MLRLKTGLSLGELEANAVGDETADRENARLELEDLSMNGAGAGAKLFSVDVVGGGTRTRNEIGDAVLELEELELVEGGEKMWREASGVECCPEEVAWTGEVMADGSRVETRIDPAEQDVKVGS